MANEIEVSLFKLLDEVSEILETNKNVEDEEEIVLNLHNVETKIETFLENFFLQFFKNGFELDIEGINEEAISQIESHFSNFRNKVSPKNIIDSFKDAVEILRDIETAVYLDPPREEPLYEAYLTFLPKLFESFKNDEAILKDRIENYGKIKVRMDSTLTKMGQLKEQRKLS